jgi:hypothetical protein
MSTPAEREARLRGVVETYRYIPFTWNVHDCVLFAARCVDAQIGTRFEYNIQRDYKYEGPISAVRIVKEAGGWEKLIERYLGPPVQVDRLEFGDVVLGHSYPPLEDTTMLGICDEELFMAPDIEGLSWLPMSNALAGWKISEIAQRQRELLNV